MRLIDADELKKKLFIADDNCNPVVTEKEIDEQPTVYDVEKIEKENEALKTRCRVLTNGTMCFFCPLECKNRTEKFRGDIGGRE